jgi:hypothetical protein
MIELLKLRTKWIKTRVPNGIFCLFLVWEGEPTTFGKGNQLLVLFCPSGHSRSQIRLNVPKLRLGSLPDELPNVLREFAACREALHFSIQSFIGSTEQSFSLISAIDSTPHEGHAYRIVFCFAYRDAKGKEAI